jgi:hypothetical protein
MTIEAYGQRYSTQPYPTQPYSTMPHPTRLDQGIAHAVATGWRVESRSHTQAVLVAGQRCNHLLHLGLTLATCGFWAPAWALMALVAREHRMVLTVDPWGRIAMLTA